MLKNQKIRDMALISVGAVIIVICTLLTIPAAIPFTMQSFGVFFVLLNFGGKRGTFSVLVYIALGLCGVPVFANFGVGISALLGPTGGYIFGFLAASVFWWILEKHLGKKLLWKFVAMCGGTVIYYAFGTAVYMLWCSSSGTPISFGSALLICVVPYVAVDIIKLIVALRTAKYFGKYINKV